MKNASLWRGRRKTVLAMILLCVAQAYVRLIPFRRWSGWLGTISGQRTNDLNRAENALEQGRRTVAVVDHAAERLPFATKCLPRAIALSWLLRRRNVAHTVVFAARPPQLRNSADALHAWVELNGKTIMGDLPGPWLETLRLGD